MLSLRLRIFYLTSHVHTNSQAHSSIGTVSGLNPSTFLSARSFRNYFTPLPGYFSPFPHGTCPLSVTGEYLALRDGPRRFRQDYTCPVVLRIPNGVCCISLTGLSPSMICLSIHFSYTTNFLLHMFGPTTPDKSGLGYSLFAHHY